MNGDDLQTAGQAGSPPAGQAGSSPAGQAAEGGSASDDIVVTGLRDIEEKDSAVTRQTLGSSRTGSAAGSRATFNLSQRWARCAVDDTPTGRAWVRRVIEGRSNSASQAFALERLGQMNATCAPDSQAAVRFGSVTDPYYDRGSLTIEALKQYAAGLKLTKQQTADPVVQARFNLRETPLAKFRLPADMKYFETAICLVRLQPELAVKLALTDKPLETVRRLEAAIVNRSKVCVGNARRVYFDGVQFRFYIADAVYRWALAAADRTSLIPD